MNPISRLLSLFRTERPAPATLAERDWLIGQVPVVARLNVEARQTWESHLNALLERVQFEGCQGQMVTREMRLLVLGQAAVLVAGRPEAPFRKLNSVLLYPAGFRVKTSAELGPHAWLEEEEDRIGESWERGTVILSWEDVDPELRDPDLAGNLVYHEFAHQLDAENNEDDGVPSLDRSLAADWQRIMGREFKALQKADKGGRETFLDPYGAENPAEFFAVVTEAYFDEGSDLKEFHPELYGLLRRYYGVDGASLS